MYRNVFPRCTVIGSVDPVPFGHFGFTGAIPSKCNTCIHLLEGDCTRAIEQVRKYLSLDHGPCPVKGPTDPVLVENEDYKSKVYIPSKCQSCTYLKLDGVRDFVCNFEHELWGAFPRTLDWGCWSPEHPNLGLESQRSLTLEVIEAVVARNEASAIKAFRSSHPDATFKEAREAYAELLTQLDISKG
jgi:hypothetical protein